MYKAIFLDLDGTLLDNQKNISEENKIAIKKARDNGVYVCLCSGRQKDVIEEFQNIAKSSKYIICSNGTQIYDCESKEELYSCSIDKDISNKIINFAIENNFYIITETNYSRYVNNDIFSKKYEIVVENNEIKQIAQKDDILQISIVSNNDENIKNAKEFFYNLKSSEVKIENFLTDVVNGERMWAINIINSSCSKGNAINGLCKYLNIDIKDVIAMGDDKNDISMINAVGLGVAMGNAQDDVKKIAKEITKTNNENGVAEIINSKILS